MGRAEPSGSFSGFTVGMQSYTFREFSVEGALKRTHELGLGTIEFTKKHITAKWKRPALEAVLRMCKKYEVTPIASGVQQFGKDHEANRQVFELGKTLGVKGFSADPDPDSFDSLDKLVEEYKLAIAIHPHGPQKGKLHRWYSAEIIMKAVKDHHPLIGSCLDTGHLIRAEQLGQKLDPAAEIRIMGARNFGVHLKDHDNQAKHDVIMGQGALDVPGVFKALKEVHFAGWISIEYEYHEDDPTSDVAACIEVIRKAAASV
jgi:sugar phosphate isomerase/epimerase